MNELSLKPSPDFSGKQSQLVPLLLELVKKDVGLPIQQKQQLVTALQNPGILSTLFAGMSGALLASMVGKYAKLSPAARMLASIGGFGLGTLLVDRLKSKVLQYDSSIGGYKVNT